MASLKEKEEEEEETSTQKLRVTYERDLAF